MRRKFDLLVESARFQLWYNAHWYFGWLVCMARGHAEPEVLIGDDRVIRMYCKTCLARIVPKSGVA